MSLRTVAVVRRWMGEAETRVMVKKAVTALEKSILKFVGKELDFDFGIEWVRSCCDKAGV